MHRGRCPSFGAPQSTACMGTAPPSHANTPCIVRQTGEFGNVWGKDKDRKHLSIHDMECGGEGGIRTLHFFVFSYGYEGIESESCLAAAEEF